jgi:hypothetical protein
MDMFDRNGAFAAAEFASFVNHTSRFRKHQHEKAGTTPGPSRDPTLPGN